jgi:hypothetical protein
MSTSYIDEQKLRLETLLQDLSLRRQQQQTQQVPPPEFLPSPSQAVPGSAAPPSLGVERDRAAVFSQE